VKTALDVLVPYGGVGLWIEREGALRMDYFAGSSLAPWKSSSLPLGEGVSGRAALAGVPVKNGDASKDLAPASKDAGQGERRPFVSASATPLAATGVRGSLTLYLAGGSQFTPEHGRILAVIGPMLATAAFVAGYWAPNITLQSRSKMRSRVWVRVFEGVFAVMSDIEISPRPSW
jgi:hypothetical protein